MNSATVNIQVHLFEYLFSFLWGIDLRLELLGHMVILCLAFLKIFIYLIYLFMAVLGLCCYARGFSSCAERGLLFVAVHGLLIVVASLVVEHWL